MSATGLLCDVPVVSTESKWRSTKVGQQHGTSKVVVNSRILNLITQGGCTAQANPTPPPYEQFWRAFVSSPTYSLPPTHRLHSKLIQACTHDHRPNVQVDTIFKNLKQQMFPNKTMCEIRRVQTTIGGTMYVFCVRILAQAAQACGPRRPPVDHIRCQGGSCR